MVEHFQRLPDRQRCGWLVRGDQWSQQPVVDFGVEDGEALPVVGEDVGVGVRQPDDQPFQAKAAQVVAAAGLGVFGVEQPSDQGSQRPVGEAAD
jgi:hypothetical protein